MQVRVENLYYLLCYAWNRLDARDLVPVGSADGQPPAALFARVFVDAAERLLRGHLTPGYVEIEDDVRRPHGKISMAATLGRGLLWRGVVNCTQDDLTEDVLHHRLIKATARTLAQLDDVPDRLAARLHRIERAMPLVRDQQITPSDFRRVQLHSNLRRYGLILHLCELVHRRTLLDTRSGRLKFHSFAGDEREMGHLFETFLRSFLSVEQRTFPTVAAPHVPWAVGSSAPDVLPVMKTDILLRKAGLRVVLEAKCYGSATVQSFGGRDVLRSKDLYQLLSYVLNLQARHPDDATVGALVYAVDNDRLRAAQFSLLGHSVLVAPINLNRPWPEIHASIQELVALLDQSSPPRA